MNKTGRIERHVGPDPLTGEVYLENYRCWRRER